MIRNPSQHVGEPCLWIDVVERGGLDQRQHDRGALAAVIGTGEQPRLAAERNAAQRAFGSVVAGTNEPIFEEAGERAEGV